MAKQVKSDNKESTEISEDLTYLKLYKMYKLAGDCQPFFQMEEEIINEDIIKLLTEYLPSSSKSRQQFFTESQFETLNIRIHDASFYTIFKK